MFGSKLTKYGKLLENRPQHANQYDYVHGLISKCNYINPQAVVKQIGMVNLMAIPKENRYGCAVLGIENADVPVVGVFLETNIDIMEDNNLVLKLASEKGDTAIIDLIVNRIDYNKCGADILEWMLRHNKSNVISPGLKEYYNGLSGKDKKSIVDRILLGCTTGNLDIKFLEMVIDDPKFDISKNNYSILKCCVINDYAFATSLLLAKTTEEIPCIDGIFALAVKNKCVNAVIELLKVGYLNPSAGGRYAILNRANNEYRNMFELVKQHPNWDICDNNNLLLIDAVHREHEDLVTELVSMTRVMNGPGIHMAIYWAITRGNDSMAKLIIGHVDVLEKDMNEVVAQVIVFDSSLTYVKLMVLLDLEGVDCRKVNAIVRKLQAAQCNNE